MSRPFDTPIVPPGAGGPTPDGGAELRRRLAQVVSRHGASVGTTTSAHLECEAALVPMYGGPYAVRAWAVLQALKGGLVTDLLDWTRTGTPGGFDALARRLSDRSGVPQPIAEWALAEWLSQLRRDAGHAGSTAATDAAAPRSARVAETPTASPTPREPPRPATLSIDALPGPDVVVRIPHLVLGGLALAGVLAIAAVTWKPAVPTIGTLGEASAATPPLPPAPSIDEPGRRGRDGAACAGARRPGPDRPPGALQAGALPMPDDAIEAGLDDGWATVRLRVDAEGRVDDEGVEVVDASHPALAASAADVAGGLRYRPARRDGCAVPATVTRTLRFTSDAVAARPLG